MKKPGKPNRTIRNALVLLVFALGKICLHKGAIPYVVPDNDAPGRAPPSIRNGHLIPLSSSRSQSSGLPLPKENQV